MTTQDLIREILRQNILLTEQQLIAQLNAEREKMGGLLSDETLLRLIAAKSGVQVQQNCFQNSGIMPTSRLVAGLNDVTVAGYLVAIFPVRSFEGEQKSGKFATAMLADSDGILRVIIWDEQTELVEKGELKINQTVRLLHGYTKEDRGGKVELHLGRKSQIEIDPTEKIRVYPPIENFTDKIGKLKSNSVNVHVSGIVKGVMGKKNFARDAQTDGAVMRLVLADDSGQITVVVWNEKTLELENIKENQRLTLINARVKDQNGFLEIHVDSNTCLRVG